MMITAFNIKDNKTLEQWVKQESGYNYFPYQIWIKKGENWTWRFYFASDTNPQNTFRLAQNNHPMVALLYKDKVIEGGYDN